MSFGGNSQSFQVEIDFVAKNQELFDKANAKAKESAAAAKSIKNAYAEYGSELKALNPELVKQIEYQNQQAAVLNKNKIAAQNLSKQIREIRATAKDIRAEVALLKDTAADIDLFAKPIFAAGAFITGGIFAAANKYVADAKVATETTIAWKKAQDSLNESGARIGAIMAKEALPVLQKSAEFASKIAGFLEAHPEVVGATLKAGEMFLVFGALLKALSGGIKLYADFKMDAALELNLTAAQLQLKAAQLQIEASGAKSLVTGEAATTAGAGGVSGIGSTVTGVLAKTVGGLAIGEILAIIGGLVAGVKGYDTFVGGRNGFATSDKFAPSIAFQGVKKFGTAIQGLTGESDTEVERKAIVAAAIIGKLTKAIDENSPLWIRAGTLAKQSAADRALALQQETETWKGELALRVQRAKDLADGFKQELQLFKTSQLDKLNELRNGFMQEVALRRAYFANIISDLSKGLSTQITMIREYIANLIKTIVDGFKGAVGGLLGVKTNSIATAGGSTKPATSTASPTWSLANAFGTHDYTGYAYSGLYKMADNGQREWVVSGSDTRALEQRVGGQLNQNNFMGAMGRGQMVWNDNRRFDGSYTEDIRRENRRDTQELLRQVFSK